MMGYGSMSVGVVLSDSPKISVKSALISGFREAALRIDLPTPN